MDAICSFETSVPLRTRQRYNPEDRTPHSHCRENLKSNIGRWLTATMRESECLLVPVFSGTDCTDYYCCASYWFPVKTNAARWGEDFALQQGVMQPAVRIAYHCTLRKLHAESSALLCTVWVYDYICICVHVYTSVFNSIYSHFI
jgi:hypothetical protein